MSANAPINLAEVAYEKRLERQRIAALSNIQHGMQAQILEIERIKTLGGADAAKALKRYRDRLAHLNLTARSLEQDFEELASGNGREEL